MSAFLEDRKHVQEWIRQLAKERQVQFPQREGEVNYAFVPVGEGSDIQFEDYRPTVTPPGKHLAPDNEILFEFERLEDGRYQFTPSQEPQDQVLAGVRPCDLKAIAQMDRVNSDAPADPIYLKRRSHTQLVVYNCIEHCDERCFCDTTGSLQFREGADVLLTPMGELMLVEAMSDGGEDLLAKVGWDTCDDAEAQRMAMEEKRPQPFGRQLRADTAALPQILRDQADSPVYERYAERCFSCGTCNLVCPTCYCFDVRDDYNLDATTGNRTRTWDACMNPGFAEVAGGHNFRPENAHRQRHRIKRKFEYLTERFGMGSFCVGCGRCGRQCTTGIDIFDIVNDIVAETGGAA